MRPTPTPSEDTLACSTHAAPARAPVRARDVLGWCLLPGCVAVAMALGCLAPVEEPCTPGSYGCETADPVVEANLARSRELLLGTWEMTAEMTAQDDVDRTVRAGAATWELEIFSVTTTSGSNANIYNWAGALRAKSLCLVNRENFDQQIEDCDTFEPTRLGLCNGHTCEVYDEVPVGGQYRYEDDRLRFTESDSEDGDQTLYNPDMGYIQARLDPYGFEVPIRNTATPKADTCGSGGSFVCRANTFARGLYEDQYPSLDGTQASLTMTRLSQDRRAADAEVADGPQEVTLGAQNAVEEVLLGDWAVQVALEGRDAVDRPVVYGTADYTLQIFEIEPSSEVGTWDFKAALRARGLCYVSQQDEQDGTFICDAFEDVSLGRCSGAECESEDEEAFNGRFNTLTNRFSLFRNTSSVSIHSIDAQGYVHLRLEPNVEDAELLGQTIAPTECTRGCSWYGYAAGVYEEDYGNRSGGAYTFAMSR